MPASISSVWVEETQVHAIALVIRLLVAIPTKMLGKKARKGKIFVLPNNFGMPAPLYFIYNSDVPDLRRIESFCRIRKAAKL